MSRRIRYPCECGHKKQKFVAPLQSFLRPHLGRQVLGPHSNVGVTDYNREYASTSTNSSTPLIPSVGV
jgi:hypothetical protein